jgi:uncharacterized protein YprB with RNaseH-like and TPR domain
MYEKKPGRVTKRSNDMFKEALEQQKKLEKHIQKQYDDHLVFFDIETGKGEVNDDITKLRASKIRRKILTSQYNYRDDWGETANSKAEIKFNDSKQAKIAREINRLTNMDALNPYYNRVVIIGYYIGGQMAQYTELEMSEEEMIDLFFRGLDGKTLIGYNSKAFDLITLQIKAAKYGLELPTYYHIDVFDKLKRWGLGKQVIGVSQEELAIVLNCRISNNDVDPATIGDVFQSARMGMATENKKEIEKILKYNDNDVLQLREIYWKLKHTGVL